ncbi:Prohibitin [Vigna unguiculata]|uniref:Prohibitin n=1 Tax=Vigna unguiculata TaxID=3917 RepID=A0A4D6LL89_VIGUN|nr:Prohibitin [Vigna unguiculata]
MKILLSSLRQKNNLNSIKRAIEANEGSKPLTGNGKQQKRLLFDESTRHALYIPSTAPACRPFRPFPRYSRRNCRRGTHFLIPRVQKPYIIDIRTRPRTFSSISGIKDLTHMCCWFSLLSQFGQFHHFRLLIR